MITSAQIRAARAMLKWSIAYLSEQSEIGTSTLKRMEAIDGVPSTHVRTLESVQKAFEEAGVEFLGSPESGAGVRWKK